MDLKEMRDYSSSNIDFGTYSGSVHDRELRVSEAFPLLMRKVYLWMTLALVITGFTAYYVATSETLMMAIFTNRAVFWGLLLGELALVVGLSAAINRLSLTAATMMFVLYSVVNGATMSSIFAAFTMSSIATTFFVTAGTFGAMAAYGYFTKSDLTSWGKILMMAVLGLIIASLVNVFLVKSSAFELLISCVGVLIFVGLTAYDSQKIKEMLLMAPDAGEGMQKLALLGALSLYLDFINLFLYLLRFFGRRE